ncbi:MAG: hypothetical protein ACOX9C_00465 [Kiritimatiellia bacterium]|jgi:hypothetical protein
MAFSHDSPSAVRARERLSKILDTSPFSLLRPLDDEAAWREAFVRTGCDPAEAIASGVRALETADWTPIPDDLYLEFSRNGNRVNYQNALSGKTAILNALLLAECAERQGRFLPAIIDGLECLYLQSKSWTLPAHDPGTVTFLGTYVHIDLVSATAAARLADLLVPFGDRLPADVRARSVAAIRRHVADPVRATLRGERPADFWMTHTNNWNAVCWAGCLRAFFALDLPREDKVAVAAAAIDNVPAFFESFHADGISSEGQGYWGYGFHHYTLLAEVLRFATHGQIDLLDEPFARLCARNPVYTAMHGAAYPTFADMAVNIHRHILPLTAWLNRRMGWGLDLPMPSTSPLSDIGALHAFHADGLPFLNDPLPSDALHVSQFLPGSGILVSRAPDCAKPFALAIKGGHNGEDHNHNDVGSYCILWNGDWLAADPGAETYTRRTFSARRYVSPLLNSFGHAVPRLGSGVLQSTGADFYGTVVEHALEPDADFYSLDLAKAYEFPPLTSLRRSVETRRKGDQATFAIDDTFEYDSPQDFETAVVVFGEAERISEDAIEIRRWIGDRAVVRVEASAPWVFSAETLDAEPNSPHYPRPTRMSIRFAMPIASGFVRVTFFSEGEPSLPTAIVSEKTA